MNVENIPEVVEVAKETAEVVKEISDAQKEYVGELMPPTDVWETLEDPERTSIVSEIFDRLVEIGFIEPNDQIKAIIDVFEKGTAEDILILAVKAGVIAAGTYFGIDLQTSAQLADAVVCLVEKFIDEDSSNVPIFVD